MNFYAESVVLLWTTAMRFGQSGGRSLRALPTSARVSHRAPSDAQDGSSITHCLARGRREKPGQH
jgi:hypothetical protein